MSAEDAAAAHEESLYHMMNERVFYGVTAGVHRAVDGDLPRAVVEQVRGAEATITEGAETAASAAAYYRDVYGMHVTNEHAVAAADAENQGLLGNAAAATYIAVQAADLQRQLFGDSFALRGFTLEPPPKSLDESRYARAVWRQAHVNVSGGRLAVCENVTLDTDYGSHAVFYGVELHEEGVQHKLGITTYHRGIFYTSYEVEASFEKSEAYGIAKHVVRDWPAVKKLLSAETATEKDVFENIRAFVLQRKLAKEGWAQDLKAVSGIMGPLVAAGMKVQQARREHIVVVNGKNKASPARLGQLAAWLASARAD